jgi:hypothetical protein
VRASWHAGCLKSRGRAAPGGPLRFLPIALALLLPLAVLPRPSRAEPRDDSYVLGYAAAVIERELALGDAEIAVEGGVVFVRAEHLDAEEREKLERVIGELDGVSGVRLVEAEEPGAARSWHALRRSGAVSQVVREDGLQIFPREDLFDPLLADPRWPHFSAAVQSYLGDDELDWAAPVSFGETIPLLGGPAFAEGRFELALHAGVFSLFDLGSDSFDLLNSDFLVGVAGTWRRGDLAVMGRLLHQSSHLGDELLLRRPIERVNLSYEALDLLVSYDLGEAFRVYGGGAYLVHRDPSDLEPWSWQLGAEAESPRTFLGGALRPIAAVDLQSRQETDWDLDLSVRAGFQLESPRWKSQRVQLLLEYYDGHSPNGQFFEREIRYLGLGAHLYF